MELKYNFNKHSSDKNIVEKYGFDKNIAEKYGVNIAILIDWFKNKGIHEEILFTVEVFENKNFIEFIISTIQLDLSFWTNREIRAILRDAVNKKALIKRNFNNNKKIHNMWYAINI